MAAQAQIEGRFLGGRPPYGYVIEDAGPHPDPAKAADGKPYRLRTSKTSTRGKRAADVATAESGPRRIRSRAFSSYVSPRTLPLPTCSTEIPLLSGRKRRSGPPGQLTRR
jgi:hypothetical protein